MKTRIEGRGRFVEERESRSGAGKAKMKGLVLERAASNTGLSEHRPTAVAQGQPEESIDKGARQSAQARYLASLFDTSVQRRFESGSPTAQLSAEEGEQESGSGSAGMVLQRSNGDDEFEFEEEISSEGESESLDEAALAPFVAAARAIHTYMESGGRAYRITGSVALRLHGVPGPPPNDLDVACKDTGDGVLEAVKEGSVSVEVIPFSDWPKGAIVKIQGVNVVPLQALADRYRQQGRDDTAAAIEKRLGKGS